MQLDHHIAKCMVNWCLSTRAVFLTRIVQFCTLLFIFELSWMYMYKITSMLTMGKIICFLMYCRLHFTSQRALTVDGKFHRSTSLGLETDQCRVGKSVLCQIWPKDYRPPLSHASKLDGSGAWSIPETHTTMSIFKYDKAKLPNNLSRSVA